MTSSLRCVTVFAVSYVYIVVSSVAVTSLLVILPGLYWDDSLTTLVVSWCVVVYFLVNVCANYYLVRTRHSFYPRSSDHESCESEWSCEWPMCTECRVHVPPRSHHCPICDRCVTARDHHCYFTASCIGARNQRYFVCFLLHCALGCAYSMYTMGMYLSALDTGGPVYRRYVLPVTFIDWILGDVSIQIVYYSLLIYVCLVTCIGTACFAAWQTLLIAHDSTSHEFTSRVKSADSWLNAKSPSPGWLNAKSNGPSWIKTNIVTKVLRTCRMEVLLHFVLPVDLLRSRTRNNEHWAKVI